jgi:endonuclease/exonuclease/phosphatase family metal-dependent hydrolase
LISRWPLAACEVFDISYQEREPRRAIRVQIDTPFGPLRVIATHLGLSVGERRSQAKTLLGLAGSDAMTTVMLGDFNDWFWAGSVRQVLAHALPGLTRHRTFPAICPVLRLDRIYCRPHDTLVRGWSDPAARHLSDHLPVIADVRIANEPRLALPRPVEMETEPTLATESAGRG